VFPVRYELNSHILFGSVSVLDYNNGNGGVFYVIRVEELP
jgi:hypothetical protein